jgi:hypothetical protein
MEIVSDAPVYNETSRLITMGEGAGEDAIARLITPTFPVAKDILGRVSAWQNRQRISQADEIGAG